MNNKRYILAGIMVLILALLMTGCGEKETAAPMDLKSALKSTEGLIELPGAAAFFCEDYGLNESDYTEISFFESEDGLGARCAILITGKDKAAADKAENALNNYLSRRMKETQNYLPEEYKLLSQAKVSRKNMTAVLIVGSDAAAETQNALKGR